MLAETPDAILENQNTAVILLNSQAQIQYVNLSAELLFDSSASQLISTDIALLFEDSNEIEHLVQAASLSEAPVFEHQGRWILRGGKECIVDVAASPIVQQGQSGVLLEVQNIDRTLRYDEGEQRRRKQETTQILVRGVAHEIKNPLGGIRGAAQLLAAELNDTDLIEYTNIIIEEADRLRNLADKMLGSREQTNKQSINIHEVTERVSQLVQVEAGNKVTIIKHYDPSIPDMLLDKEQLIQAVLNIMRNAIQALVESGTSPAIITVRSRIARHLLIADQIIKLACRIDIIDNGPGINDELLSDIFYPMISGRAKGTGLGLSIAQQIVSRHAGSIECDSYPGRTCFSVFLPIELN